METSRHNLLNATCFEWITRGEFNNVTNYLSENKDLICFETIELISCCINSFNSFSKDLDFLSAEVLLCYIVDYGNDKESLICLLENLETTNEIKCLRYILPALIIIVSRCNTQKRLLDVFGSSFDCVYGLLKKFSRSLQEVNDSAVILQNNDFAEAIGCAIHFYVATVDKVLTFDDISTLQSSISLNLFKFFNFPFLQLNFNRSKEKTLYEAVVCQLIASFLALVSNYAAFLASHTRFTNETSNPQSVDFNVAAGNFLYLLYLGTIETRDLLAVLRPQYIWCLCCCYFRDMLRYRNESLYKVISLCTFLLNRISFNNLTANDIDLESYISFFVTLACVSLETQDKALLRNRCYVLTESIEHLCYSLKYFFFYNILSANENAAVISFIVDSLRRIIVRIRNIDASVYRRLNECSNNWFCGPRLMDLILLSCDIPFDEISESILHLQSRICASLNLVRYVILANVDVGMKADIFETTIEHRLLLPLTQSLDSLDCTRKLETGQLQESSICDRNEMTDITSLGEFAQHDMNVVAVDLIRSVIARIRETLLEKREDVTVV